MTRGEIEALVAKERPGWRVVDFIEVNDESGPSFEVTIENGGRQTTLLVGEGKRIVGERRLQVRKPARQREMVVPMMPPQALSGTGAR